MAGDGFCCSKVLTLLQVVGALFISVVFMLEALVKCLIPRKFQRHDITGQVVLITGSGSGLGRLVAIKMAKLGARVVCWDVNATGNEETATMVRDSTKAVCHAYTVDLCDRKQIYKTASKVKQDVGKVDILINNAGIVTGKNFKDSPDELIQKTFNVNIMSHFWTTKAFLPDMLAENKGHVVTIASLAGHIGINKLADYCASKFAAVGFDESLRNELRVEGFTGVHTTVVCPVYINTGMFDGVKSKLLPILEPDYVASEIVDGILMRSVQLILPGYCSVFIFLKSFMPLKAYRMVYDVIGCPVSLENFKGHAREEKRSAGV